MSGPRKGSMSERLLNLKEGESTLFEAKAGKGMIKQQHVGACAARNGLTGKLKQEIFIGVQVISREVIDVVRVTRIIEDDMF